ncbi:MAG: hypothetical protein KAH08_08930, partial [Methylococcales bacterium]|nr:hypothetical protein [Methylococcales bacterium]
DQMKSLFLLLFLVSVNLYSQPAFSKVSEQVCAKLYTHRDLNKNIENICGYKPQLSVKLSGSIAAKKCANVITKKRAKKLSRPAINKLKNNYKTMGRGLLCEKLISPYKRQLSSLSK